MEITLIKIRCVRSTAMSSINGTSMWYDVCLCVFVCVHLTHMNWDCVKPKNIGLEGKENYINEIIITSKRKATMYGFFLQCQYTLKCERI